MQHSTGFWQWLLGQFAGETISILGAEGTGKSTFFHFLGTGDCESMERRATAESEPIESCTLKDDKGCVLVRLQTTKDIGGGKENLEQWKERTLASHRLVYMLRGDLLLDGSKDVDDRIWRDFTELDEMLGGINKKILNKFHVVCNFCDKHSMYESLTSVQRHNYYQRELRSLKAVKYALSVSKQLTKRTDQVHLHAGSLATNDSAEELTTAIFTTIQ